MPQANTKNNLKEEKVVVAGDHCYCTLLVCLCIICCSQNKNAKIQIIKKPHYSSQENMLHRFRYIVCVFTVGGSSHLLHQPI